MFDLHASVLDRDAVYGPLRSVGNTPLGPRHLSVVREYGGLVL